MRCPVSQYIGVMNSPTDDGFDLVLDELAYIDVISFTDGDERGMDLWVQFRPNILAIQRHGLSETAGVKKNGAAHLRGLFRTCLSVQPVKRQCGVSGRRFCATLSNIANPGWRHSDLCRDLGVGHARFSQVLNALRP